MTTGPKVVRVQPLREQVLESLIDALHKGRFRPGDRLTEEAMAEYLEVSRTPVREALGILVQRGLLSRREGRGFVVPSPGAKNIDDSFELRRLLEPYAIRKLVGVITDDQIAALRKLLEVLKDAVDRGAAADAVQANLELRRAIFNLIDNEALSRAISQVTDHVQLIGALTMNNPKVRKLLLSKHERILKSIRARDPKAAEKASLEYLEAAHAAAHEALPPEK